MITVHALRRCIGAALTVLLVAATAPAGSAQASTATITGIVLDQQGGLPIPNAAVALLRGEATVASTATGPDGRYAFPDQNPGVYTLAVRVAGYEETRSSEIVVGPGAERAGVDLALTRASTTANLQTIGRTTTAASARSLQTGTTITRSVDPQTLQAEGFNRLGDGLGLLPGVNLRGQNANTGDDLYVDIRGLKPSETQTLLDGHPIGPVGVNASTTSGGYDYMASPLVGLRNVQVTYGAGALGLYGTDSAGGTVDWQTLNPSQTLTGSVSQQYGSHQHLSTAAVVSGTAGRVGFVLAHGVLGTQGLFDGSPQLQSGLLGTTLTSANYAKNTYPISGDTLIRSDLGKLRFDFGPTTQLTLTAFATNAWEDKTGTGNNFTPYDTQLFATLQKGLATSGPCKGLVAVTTDAGQQCLSATQYATLTSGPAGTGAGRTTTTGDQDYHARLTSQLFGGNLTFDAFQNTYRYNNSTPISQTTTVPTFATDLYQTFGFLASDDYTFGNNEVGVGWYVQHQAYDSIRNDYFNQFVATAKPRVVLATGNIFLRDVWSPSRAVQLFVNAWYKQSTSSVVNANSIDPRASLVLRPTPSDVIRFTGGSSVGLPDPAQAIGSGFSNAGSLNPQCNNLQAGVGGISVGTPGVTGLQPEKSTDVEFAYGHRFPGGTTIQGDYYNSAVKNLLFTTTVNATLLPPGTIPPTVLGNANGGLFGRIYNYSAACKALLNPNDPNSLIPYLAFSVPTNAANGLFRGIEVTVRHQVDRYFSIEGTWDVQSAVATDIPVALLKQNVYVANGAQLFGIPLQKQNLAMEYTNGLGRVSAHVDLTRFGAYNQFDAPPFIVVNSFVSKQFGSGTALTLGGTNLMGSRDKVFAATGVGLFVPENQFGTDVNSYTQSATYNKLRSYQPVQVTLTLTQRF